MDIEMVIVAGLCVLLSIAIAVAVALRVQLEVTRDHMRAIREEANEFRQYVLDWAGLHQASLDDLKAETTFFTMPRPRNPHHQKSKPDTDEPNLDLRQVLPFGDYDFDSAH